MQMYICFSSVVYIAQVVQVKALSYDILYSLKNKQREISVANEEDVFTCLVIVDIIKERASEMGLQFDFFGVEQLFSREVVCTLPL
jgi:hypothetical protein